jgi:hypothetical protein
MNISFVLLGLLLSLFSAHALLHRHYEYFDRGERGWGLVRCLPPLRRFDLPDWRNRLSSCRAKEAVNQEPI